MKRNYPFLPCSVFCKGAEKKTVSNQWQFIRIADVFCIRIKWKKEGKKGKKN